ncbi:MAG: ROK family glucokinase [Austwickia sp.]|nr:ROK family glucokinase [Austwickia sp.]MBK8435583.1 ROK family glucokinase [Austwickia sp.]MBK9100847.1 ROK family glucokinase [Austwickia sp.]
MTGRSAIGIDIGGTKVSGALVRDDGSIRHRLQRVTPHRTTSPDVVLATIVGLVRDLLVAAEQDQHGPSPGRSGTSTRPDALVSAIGIGAAGWVSSDRATVVFAPHLSWRHEPLQERLAAILELPVFVDNDANAAGWAEWRFGAGRGEPNLVMITLGTGIGGSLVVDGRIQRGRFGLAGEFGHMQVVPGGHRCACGNRGCWEQYASGRALIREARAIIDTRSPVARELSALAAAEPGGLSGPMITQAARGGDRTATELIGEIGQWLGVGLANIAAAVDPGGFVIGGGVSAAGELLLGPARESYRRCLPGRGYRDEAFISAAELGNDAGVIGAADLARSALR